MSFQAYVVGGCVLVTANIRPSLFKIFAFFKSFLNTSTHHSKSMWLVTVFWSLSTFPMTLSVENIPFLKYFLNALGLYFKRITQVPIFRALSTFPMTLTVEIFYFFKDFLNATGLHFRRVVLAG